jgi:hypothetical protein
VLPKNVGTLPGGGRHKLYEKEKGRLKLSHKSVKSYLSKDAFQGTITLFFAVKYWYKTSIAK